MEKKDNRVKLDTPNTALSTNLSRKYETPIQEIIRKSLELYDNSMQADDIPPDDIHYIRKSREYMKMIIDLLSGCIKDKNLSAEKKLKDYDAKLSAAEEKIETQSETINKYEKTIASYKDEIDTLKRRISELEQHVSEQTAELAKHRKWDEISAKIDKIIAAQDTNQQK